MGRFTQADPGGINLSEKALFNPQYLNLYSYSLNNPLRYIDPDGKAPWDSVAGFFVGFTEGVGDTAIWIGEKVAHPVQSVKDAGNTVQEAVEVIKDVADRPADSFKEAAQGFGLQAQEFGEWYWNASDYERGKVLGHVAEKAAEAYVIAKVGGKVGSIKGSNIKGVNIAEILNNENKFHHIFDNPAHDLNLLGTPQEVLQKASNALLQADKAGLIPKSGTFEVVRTIEGNSVTIRGTVIDGIARIGTVFIKK